MSEPTEYCDRCGAEMTWEEGRGWLIDRQRQSCKERDLVFCTDCDREVEHQPGNVEDSAHCDCPPWRGCHETPSRELFVSSYPIAWGFHGGSGR